MKFCFFITHPAKFHFLKATYDELVSEGHEVHWVGISKDVLEALVVQSGYDFKNIYKRGRKSSIFPKKIYAAFTFGMTILKLIVLQLREKYDVIVTDDAGVIQGKIFGKPSIFILDNDLSTLSYASFLLDYATYIFAPASTDVGHLEAKKVPFQGVKALMHLHPNRFQPETEYLTSLPESYAFVRVSHLNAAHDTANAGITDDDLKVLVELLENHFGAVLISAQRPVDESLQKYLVKPPVDKMSNVLYKASVVVTDSGTMASEAAILGVPNYLVNNLSFKIGVHHEMMKANIQKCYESFPELMNELPKDLNHWTKAEFQNWSKSYIESKGDPNNKLIELLENIGK